MSRPNIYTRELGEQICAFVSQAYSLREIECMEGMPAVSTICLWLNQADKHEFMEQYEQAQAIKAENLADELLAIADNGTNDYMQRSNPDNPGWVANGEHIQRSRLRVDTRKWIAAKLLPKKYGDRNTTELIGLNSSRAVPTEASQMAADTAIAEYLKSNRSQSSHLT